MHKHLDKQHLKDAICGIRDSHPALCIFQRQEESFQLWQLFTFLMVYAKSHTLAFNSHDDFRNLEKSKENLFFVDKVNSTILTHSSLIRELKIHSRIWLPFCVLHEATFPT